MASSSTTCCRCLSSTPRLHDLQLAHLHLPASQGKGKDHLRENVRKIRQTQRENRRKKREEAAADQPFKPARSMYQGNPVESKFKKEADAVRSRWRGAEAVQIKKVRDPHTANHARTHIPSHTHIPCHTQLLEESRKGKRHEFLKRHEGKGKPSTLKHPAVGRRPNSSNNNSSRHGSRPGSRPSTADGNGDALVIQGTASRPGSAAAGRTPSRQRPASRSAMCAILFFFFFLFCFVLFLLLFFFPIPTNIHVLSLSR